MLKVAVLSDTHLGFAAGAERENDCYENFEQAIGLAIKEDVQLILLCGDIFHDKIPRQEVLGKSIEIFTRINKAMEGRRPALLKRVKSGNTETFKNISLPPVIAIWGTHERRHPGSTNPVNILEKAGLLGCLHAESILIECNSDRLGIHGLSGVPEPQACDALKAWNPRPFEDCFNVMMLHQNIKEAMPPVDYSISFSDLPREFISLCGHIHNHSEHRHPISRNPIIIVGSTVSTQLQKVDSEVPKGFYIFEFGRENFTYKFMPIKTRPFFYRTLQVDGKTPADIFLDVGQEISSVLKENAFHENLKPIVRIKLDGTLAEGFRPEDFNFGKVFSEFEQKAILSLDKSNLVSADSGQHSRLLEELRDKKLSIDEIGTEILAKNLGLNIGAEKLGAIFQFLSDGEIERAENAIDGKFEVRPEASSPPQDAEPQITKEQYADIKKEISQIKQEQAIRKVEERILPVKPAPSAPDPQIEQLAESGMSLLAGLGKQSTAQAMQKLAPQAVMRNETSDLAESGLSKNTGQGVARSDAFFNSQDSQSGEFGLSRLATSSKPANHISKTIQASSKLSVANAMPAPKISDLAARRGAQEAEKSAAPKEMLMQSGKISGAVAEFSLSKLASLDKKAGPAIRLKNESLAIYADRQRIIKQGQVQKIVPVGRAEQQAGRLRLVAGLQPAQTRSGKPEMQAPARVVQRDELDDNYEPINKAPKFNVKKWLEKDF